jgi:hypothetical protein
MIPSLRLIIIALLAFCLSGNAQKIHDVENSKKSLDNYLNSDGTIKSGNGFTGSFNANGYELTIDSDGKPHFIRSSNPHSYDYINAAGDENWDDRFDIPGVNGQVKAIAVIGNDLYIGGTFTSVHGIAANNIAFWNGNIWQPMGSGVTDPDQDLCLNNTVNAIVVKDNNVYVGGGFTKAGGKDIPYLARWDGQDWYSLGGHANNEVAVIKIDGNNIFAGGYFSHIGGQFSGDSYAGGIPVNNIAKWNGSEWTPLGDGVNDTGDPSCAGVRAIAVNGSDIYVGGRFAKAGNVSANNIAKWDGTNWSALGTGIHSDKYGIGPVVNAIEVMNGDVYVGGSFTGAGSTSARHIARWDGIQWYEINQTFNTIWAIKANDNNLYVAGQFYGGVSKWDGENWSIFSNGPFGHAFSSAIDGDDAGSDIYSDNRFINNNFFVYSIALIGNNIYVGGQFPSGIAKWDGNHWYAIGNEGYYGANGDIHIITIHNNDIYVGGNFSMIGGIEANCIAKWNDTSWSRLGSGFSGRHYYTFFHQGRMIRYHYFDGPCVKTIVIDGNNVYAGGTFKAAGGNNALCIASWNGSTWSGIGGGVKGGDCGDWGDYPTTVNAIDVVNDDIYIGGTFTKAGDTDCNGLAKWNGSSWSDLKTMTLDPTLAVVKTITSDGSNIYVGGEYFYIQDDTDPWAFQTMSFAEWNGTEWSDMGFPSSINNSNVTSIALYGNDIYLGGVFQLESKEYLLKWNGTTWSTVDINLPQNDHIIQTVSVFENNLLVGGNFSSSEGAIANYIAKWDGNSWSSLGSGTNGEIHSIAVNDNIIYTGGKFTTAGGKPSHHYAIWYESHDPPPPSPYTEITFIDDFEDGDSNGWTKHDPARWTVDQDGSSKAFYINTSDYPANSNERLGEYALIDNNDFENFTFTCQARSCDDLSVNGYADYCIIFNYQDPTNYYYMMFNKGESATILYQIKPDGRSEIKTAPGSWIVDNDFHNIEITRIGSEIWVQYDSQVVLYSNNVSGKGQIGMGSYNDAASFDNVTVKCKDLPSPPPPDPHTEVKFSDDFEDGNADGWAELNPSKWTVGQDNNSKAYYINTTAYSPGPNDKLGEYSLIESSNYNDFTLNCQARTREDLSSNSYADYCIVFGYQNDNNYYYLMFNKSRNVSGLFKITPGIRTLIQTAHDFRIEDVIFHDIQIIRIGSAIWVKYDSEVILYSNNAAGTGQIGIGSINDASSFDNVIIKYNESGPPPQNNPPIANNDSAFVQQDSSVLIQVLLNDNDIDGDPLHIQTIDTTGTNGDVSIDPGDTTITYSTVSGFAGQDTFSYTVSDNRGGLDTALVTVTVTEPHNNPPIAKSDSVIVRQDSTVCIYALQNDTDIDGDNLCIQSLDTTGTSGTVVIDPGDTTVTYSPAQGFTGKDSFSYTVTDGKGGIDTSAVIIEVIEITNIMDSKNKPVTFNLFQNYPNPFNPTTTIFYSIAKPAKVQLTIYNIKGSEIVRLVDETKESGIYHVNWNGMDKSGQLLSSGIYIYQLETENFIKTKKMIFMR